LLYFKKSVTLKLFELSPITDFASANCCNLRISCYLLGEIASQLASYISHNYTPHSLFQFNLIPTFPPAGHWESLEKTLSWCDRVTQHFL